MNLLALTVQRPGAPLGVSLVMRSEQGAGKGVFMDAVGELFHPHHYAHLTTTAQAVGRFNKPILGKIVTFLDHNDATVTRCPSLRTRVAS